MTVSLLIEQLKTISDWRRGRAVQHSSLANAIDDLTGSDEWLHQPPRIGRSYASSST